MERFPIWPSVHARRVRFSYLGAPQTGYPVGEVAMPDPQLMRVTPANVDQLGIHCVESREHPGRQAKIEWFKREYARGLRILMVWSAQAGKSVGFIEYAPGESAWRAVRAANYLVVHCICVKVAGKGQGHGSRLVHEVLDEAQKEQKNGVVVVTSTGTWCAKSAIFEKNGFERIDERPPFGLWVARAEGSQNSARGPLRAHAVRRDLARAREQGAGGSCDQSHQVSQHPAAGGTRPSGQLPTIEQGVVAG
jgi:L-amino acid N-acyltransferase YncA